MSVLIKRIRKEISSFLEKYPLAEAVFDESSNRVIGKYNNVPFQINLHTNFPLVGPIFFINKFQFTNEINWAPGMNLLDVIVDKINKIGEHSLFIPKTSGFYTSSDERNFSSDDLHDNGNLYNCRNFDSKKYQFGSGFIYSLINVFKTNLQLHIPEENIHEYIDILLDAPLIKELSCVYLVFKIYEEKITLLDGQTIESLKGLIKSPDIKKQFHDRLSDFKKHYSDIFSISDRADLLNMVLTIYINIWLYSKIINGVETNNLDDIIQQYMAIKNSTELYTISEAFLGDKSISKFNSHLFLDNYGFVEHILRDNSGKIEKFSYDWDQIFTEFTQMIDIDGKLIGDIDVNYD